MSLEPSKAGIKELEKPSIIADLWQAVLARERTYNHPDKETPLRNAILTFAEYYLHGQMKRKSSVSLMIRECIAEIQARIGEQLDEILHDQRFQALEARWQGLSFFIRSSQSPPIIRIRVLPVSKSELLKDFERSVQFDRSALFKQVYEKEFGTFGGTPYSFLIGDFEFSRSPQDLTLLQNIAKIASAAHAPFISGVHPGLMDMSTFSELGSFRHLGRLFESKELIKWHAFRDSEDSRYVVLVLPRILLRLPYGRLKGRLHPGAIHYDEVMQGTDSASLLWGNAAFALGQRICKSFERFGWLAKFLGVDESGAGVVTGLPLQIGRAHV